MYHCCITVVLFYGQSEIFKEEEFFIPALRLCGLKDTYHDKCVAEKAIHLSVHTAYAMILHSRGEMRGRDWRKLTIAPFDLQGLHQCQRR